MINDGITAGVVEQVLKAMRSGEKLSPGVLNLTLFGQKTDCSPEISAIKKIDFLLSLITSNYLLLRKAEELKEDLPQTRPEILARLGEDFSRSNSELEAWSSLYHRYLAVLQISVEELSASANVVPQVFRRRINQGLAILVRIIRRMEIDAAGKEMKPLRYVPLPDYTHLFNVEPYFKKIDLLLDETKAPCFVSLEGIGGIGKTALTRAYVSQPAVISRWNDILWVSARQEQLLDKGQLVKVQDAASTCDDITERLATQLGLLHLSGRPVEERMQAIQSALTAERYLVVVDNLETVSDYRMLVPFLAKTAGKSAFIITSRKSLKDFPFIHPVPVRELDSETTQALLQSEMQRRGRMLEITKAEYDALYRIIGGIPLAAKLVAAQLGFTPLSTLLQEFRRGGQGKNAFYRYIYARTWQMLSETSRRLLFTFLSIDPEGEDLGFIQCLSGEPEEVILDSLQELDNLSLLEISGSSAEPRYHIHRLTTTFLQTELLKQWEATGSQSGAA